MNTQAKPLDTESNFKPFSLTITFETAREAALFDVMFYSDFIEKCVGIDKAQLIQDTLRDFVPLDDVWDEANDVVSDILKDEQ